MRQRLIGPALIGFAVLLAAAAPLQAEPANITAAIADSARPAADVARDGARKPAAMLAFAGVTPGMTVLELMPGGGYFTRLFAKAVSPGGHVYAFAPVEQDKFAKDQVPPVIALAAQYDDLTVIHQPLLDVSAPKPVDLVWTAQNYHDVKIDAPDGITGFNRKIFAALKPGGLYIVLDHSAVAGSGLEETKKLHRIDEAVVKAEVTAAGFEFVGASDVLRNPADPRTQLVFDPAIRGHTDQFILKFRKP